MSRVIRSRRAGRSQGPSVPAPLYARLLRLRHLTPSGFLCFVFLEGAVTLGILLALAELVSWWGVLVMPLTVAAMVKLNDVVAGAATGAAGRTRRPEVRVPTKQWGVTSRPLPVSTIPGVHWAPVRPARMDYRRLNFELPDLDRPNVQLPEVRMPEVRMPEVRVPEVRVPEVRVPEVRVPEVRVPEVRMPEVRAPEVRAPGKEMPMVGPSVAMPVLRTTDASALNGPPVTRQWSSRAEHLDHAQQWARQAASRRYD